MRFRERTRALSSLIAIAALVTTHPPAAGAQARAARTVTGRLIGVYDELTGDPIDSVEVRDMLTGSYTFTSRTGAASLFFVDTAGTLVRIRKFGYTPITMFVGNAPGLLPVTLTLARAARRLPAVVTRDSAAHYLSPALSAFEARRKTGLGYFVSEAELRKEDSRPLANVLRSHVPSLAIQDIFVKGQHLTIAASRRGGCGVDIFLDGIPLAPTPIAGALSPGRSGRPAAPPPAYVDLSQFNVTDLAGVEFHNVGDLPAEFEHTGNGCVALYLWTRER